MHLGRNPLVPHADSMEANPTRLARVVAGRLPGATGVRRAADSPDPDTRCEVPGPHAPLLAARSPRALYEVVHPRKQCRHPEHFLRLYGNWRHLNSVASRHSRAWRRNLPGVSQLSGHVTRAMPVIRSTRVSIQEAARETANHEVEINGLPMSMDPVSFPHPAGEKAGM